MAPQTDPPYNALQLPQPDVDAYKSTRRTREIVANSAVTLERAPCEENAEVRGAEKQNGCVGKQDIPICWICLDGARVDRRLVQPCACPRFAHAQCLARWQLQSAGSRRETHCEFCDLRLPDWKRTLTPTCGADAQPVMNVNFDGRTYSFEVRPGPEGYRHFTESIRKAFKLPEDSELNITFTCDEPSNGDAPLPPPPPPTAVTDAQALASSLLTLQGAGAYDAAVHCASVSAARRLVQQQQSGVVDVQDAVQTPEQSVLGYSQVDDTAPDPVPCSSGSGPVAAAAGSSDARPATKKRLPGALARKLRSLFTNN